jgi:hypothetical protein
MLLGHLRSQGLGLPSRQEAERAERASTTPADGKAGGAAACGAEGQQFQAVCLESATHVLCFFFFTGFLVLDMFDICFSVQSYL